MKIMICNKCGYVAEKDGVCPYDLTKLSSSEELECVPMEGNAQFKLDRELAFLLQKYAGKKCIIRITEK